MEDQAKRLLLAVALAFGIMLLWNVLFPPDKPKPPDTKDQATEQTAGQTGDKGADKTAPPVRSVELAEPGAGTAPADAAVGPVAEPNPCKDDDAADPIVFDLPLYRAEFSRCGGTLRSWQLRGGRYLVEAQGGERRPMDLVPRGADGPQALFPVRFENIDWDPLAYWRAERRGANEIAFTWEYKVADAGGTPRTAFELTKVYKLYPDDYLVELSFQISNKAAKDERQTAVLSLYGYQDPAADTSGGWTSVDTAWRSSCFNGEDESRSSVHSLAKKSPKLREARTIKWAGFAHSYFLAAAAPRNETGALYGCNSYSEAVDGKMGLMRTDLVFPETNVRLGSWTEHVVVAYLGPKYLDRLESIPKKVGFNPGFADAIDLGWFSVLARPMLWLLQWFHSFLGNWGLAIIALTLLVKLATLHWTNKSMRSMKQMAKLAPLVKELEQKHKGDRTRIQQETMALYKTHNVSMVAGCLPMLLQMPIWIALYRMLMQAAELYHAPLIPGWIDDLTSTDPYYILPVALLGVMFAQARLTPSTQDNVQQKIMQYGMPIMFGVMAFFFPAGLTLYIFTNTTLTAAHHLWMRRNDPPPAQPGNKGQPGAKAAAAPAEAGARTSGRKAQKSSAKAATAAKPGSDAADAGAADSADRDDADEAGDDSDDSDDSDNDEGESASADQARDGGQTKSKKAGAKRRSSKRGKARR